MLSGRSQLYSTWLLVGKKGAHTQEEDITNVVKAVAHTSYDVCTHPTFAWFQKSSGYIEECCLVEACCTLQDRGVGDEELPSPHTVDQAITHTVWATQLFFS